MCGFGNFNLFKEPLIRSVWWKEKYGSKNGVLVDGVLIYFSTDCYFQVSVFVFGDASLKGSGYQLMTELRVRSKESAVGGALDPHIPNENVSLLLPLRNDLPVSCNSVSLFPHKYSILLCQLPVTLVPLPYSLTFILPSESRFPLKQGLGRQLSFELFIIIFIIIIIMCLSL